jgi:DNA primase
MDFAQHLKSSVDIVRTIGEYGVKLRKASPNRYQGLCPFHTEKTPSFSVYTQIQRYKCFGCNESGDVIKFVEKIEGLSFWEALKELAERNGIPMPKRAEYTDPETKLRAGIYEMHEIAAEMFKAAFRTSAASQARDYVVKRALTPALVDQFGIGFSDPSGQALARRFREKGFSDEQLEKSGLVRRREDGSFYDYFRGRLMFPIHGETGKIVAFAGRALKDEEPKYLNSPQTPIYQKSNILYNLNRARNAIHKFDHSVLVEGYMDVIGVFSAGVEEVVASCGTALTQQQVKMLKRHSERIVVNFDPDNAGANAAERSIQMFLEEGMQVRVLELEEGLDPDEYVKQFGADVYRKKLETATNYFHWLADRARKKFDVRSVEGRMQGFQFLLPAIQRIPHKLERLAVANDVASYLGVEAGAVLEQFRKSAGDRKSAPAVKHARPAVPPVERILLRRVLFDAGAREAALPRLAELPSLGRMATERIFQAILACDAQGETVEFSRVEARLDESSKTLLHEVAFADDIDEASDAVEETLACLNALEGIDLETQRAELRSKVRAAERSGNLQEALHWNRELLKLERSGG